METTTALLLALGTLAVGVVLGWLWHSSRAVGRNRSEEIETVRLHSELEGARREIAHLREQVELARGDGDRRVAEAEQRHQREVTAVREQAERQVAEVKGDQERMAQQFRSLAGEALSSSNRQFLELAEQRLKQSTVRHDEALAQREEAFKALVDPIGQSLEKVRTEVAEQEKRRIEFDSRLTENMRSLADVSGELRKGTSDLVTALRSSQERGAWGELQLQRVVEAAGMIEQVDFDVQVQATNDDGETLRPDLVVNLAGGKHIVVDSKVAFLGYLEAQQSEDPAVRDQRMAAHVRHMRKHVDDLASKRYWDLFDNAPEFVVMFVPAESFLSAALERDPALMEDAARKNVILASPVTLLALLRTVAYSWRQQALADNAQRVLKVGKELHSRLVTMTDHVTKMGKSLDGATKNYNKMIGSLERNVLTSARRMVELDVVDARDEIDEMKGLEETTRPITKPELLAAEEGGVVGIGQVSIDDDRDSVEDLVDTDRRALQRAQADTPRGESAAG
ncbi:DNA recombination protein RmuC [Isoptericola sp. b408]|uniref:DNA recombination protein RmuC n=1 Tax=Isoptericola sp. b408 TaxID=3064653 RepID=UPI0027130193|nr:DNA recombination protein RmuC [Isoptericola sp. b408]MDO8151614.1 DNA recombination protein RmuC [Isoptericola sp. b408]